jgi:hypothetical protein
LQPYMVTLPQQQFVAAQRHAAVRVLFPDASQVTSKSPAEALWQWCASYDALRGIVVDGLPMPEYFIV